MPAGINFSAYIALTHKVSFLLSDNLDTEEGYAKPEQTEAEPGSVQMLRAEAFFSSSYIRGDGRGGEQGNIWE